MHGVGQVASSEPATSAVLDTPLSAAWENIRTGLRRDCGARTFDGWLRPIALGGFDTDAGAVDFRPVGVAADALLGLRRVRHRLVSQIQCRSNESGARHMGRTGVALPYKREACRSTLSADSEGRRKSIGRPGRSA